MEVVYFRVVGEDISGRETNINYAKMENKSNTIWGKMVSFLEASAGYIPGYSANYTTGFIKVPDAGLYADLYTCYTTVYK